MRVAINGYFREHPYTGSGIYLARLVEHLRRLATGDDFELLSRPAPLRRFGKAGKVLWEQFGFPRASRGASAELSHVPYFGPPAGGCETLTIHDLIGLVLPAYSSSPWMRLYYRLAARGARNSKVVLTDSASSAADIARLLRIPGDRIKVVPLGVDPPPTSPDPLALDAVRRRYVLPDRLALYLGGGDVRKNIGALLQAWFLMPERERVPLVLAGNIPCSGSELFPDYRLMAAGYGLREWVRFLGPIPESDKASLLAAAAVFVFPSTYEGFGLEPLEAMSCGVPVVCSNASSLPEVVGDAALLMDPDEPGQWAESVVRVLDDASLSTRLSEAGRARAAEFTWERTARATLDAYRSAL